MRNNSHSEIVLFAEKGFEADLRIIAKNLNKLCKKLKFKVGKTSFIITDKIISHPDTYLNLDKDLLKEAKGSFKTFLFTNKRYDNNYFFQSAGNLIIVSFFGWSGLTTLSKNNGVVYFIADLIALYLDNSFRHDDSTGCIYDFGWDKTVIDIKMRNAFICPHCLLRISNRKMSSDEQDLFIEVREILDVLGKTSKWNQDIIDYWKSSEEPNTKSKGEKLFKKLETDFFDAFLAHNSADKSIVEKISQKLKNRGIKPWFDQEQIPPGRWFQDLIQDTIIKIPSIVIFIGKNGMGRWETPELRAAINQCVKKGTPIIPVLLPGVSKIPEKYVFLNDLTWVKFKNSIDEKEPLDNLVWGITGRHPKRN